MLSLMVNSLTAVSGLLALVLAGFVVVRNTRARSNQLLALGLTILGLFQVLLALPLFVLGTFILWMLDRFGGLAVLEEAAAPVVVGLLDLPKEAAGAFILGFLRRDYA